MGKDADPVIAAGCPMQITVKPDAVFLNGKKVFDRKESEQKGCVCGTFHKEGATVIFVQSTSDISSMRYAVNPRDIRLPPQEKARI